MVKYCLYSCLITASEAGQIKLNYTFPSQFVVSAHLFSNTF